MLASAAQQVNPGYVDIYPLPLETPAHTAGPPCCHHRAPSSAPRAAHRPRSLSAAHVVGVYVSPSLPPLPPCPHDGSLRLCL